MDGNKSVDSKFRLCILAAKRAKQIVNGAKKKVDIKAENPLSVAIEEISHGKINFHILESEEPQYTQEDIFDELDELSELTRDNFADDDEDELDMDEDVEDEDEDDNDDDDEDDDDVDEDEDGDDMDDEAVDDDDDLLGDHDDSDDEEDED